MNKQVFEAISLADEEGDTMASLALRDMAEEEGQQSCCEFWRPQAGDRVAIFTGMYFHVGVLSGEDHEYYGLQEDSQEVYETGPLDTFYKGEIKSAEAIPVPIVVRKGPTVKIALMETEAKPAKPAKPLEFWRPQAGDRVAIFTGMYFHVGTLSGEDHEYYGLEEDSQEVYETGPLDTFYKGEIKSAEAIPVPIVVRKGPTVKIARFEAGAK